MTELPSIIQEIYQNHRKYFFGERVEKLELLYNNLHNSFIGFTSLILE